MGKKKDNQLIIYETKDGKVDVRFNLDYETVWLSLNQIAILFGRDKSVISRHIKNIFDTKELVRDQTVAFFATVQKEGEKIVTRNIEYFNLDMIISVGYRVNSKKATKFRIWATNILKDYLVKGYAINEKRVSDYKERLDELNRTIKLLESTVTNQVKNLEEAKSLLKIITDYGYALSMLDDYDHQKIKIRKTTKKEVYKLSYKEAKKIIKTMKNDFSSHLFGKEKDESFKSSISTIYQTFDGKELYPSLEEKASNLLYFIIKNHSFIDGNKRIAATLFLYFMSKNNVLYRADGSKRIADNALVAITLMIAESKPQEKNLILKVVVNLINGEN